MKAILVEVILSLLGKLAGMVFKAWEEAKKIKDIKRKQKKKEEAVENAEAPEDIRNAHSNNRL